MNKPKIIIGAVVILLVLVGVVIIKKDNAHAPSLQNKTITGVAPGLNKAKNSTSDPSSIWVVVNKQHALNPLTYTPADLVLVGNGQKMRTEAAGALQNLVAAAATQKLVLKPLSGFRSYDTQQTVYAKEVATYGQTRADTQSAKPGTSEHQTGWAIDVGGGGCGIEDCFGQTAEGKWLAANAYQFGFIVRYTSENTAVTGYRAEPWHIRYIGRELSNELHRTNTGSLEQFFSL